MTIITIPKVTNSYNKPIKPTNQRNTTVTSPIKTEKSLKKDTVTLMGKEINKKKLACGIGAVGVLSGMIAFFAKKNSIFLPKKSTTPLNELVKINISKTKPEIKTDEEFEIAMKKLMDNPEFIENWKKDDPVSSIISVYAGCPDRSRSINTNMRNKYYKDSFINEVTRCLKYGLKKVDERYGNYQGIVYRGGYFGDNGTITTQNFVSTSMALDTPVKKMYGEGIHVIQTNHGHRIDKVQESMHDLYAQIEREILLDPNKKFEEIKELTPELIKIKQKVIEKAAWYDENYIYYNGECTLPIRFWKEVTE